MNKVFSVGIVISLIVIGILVVFSINSSTIIKPDNLTSELISENEDEDSGHEAKPPGRDLSIELEENMGLSAP